MNNRSELKEYVMQTLLEVVDYPGKVKGKLIKKALGYKGIQREVVSEGTVTEANEWATDNELTFVNSGDSDFGGHYEDGTAVYEFHPNPEYYGEMMETDMSAQETFARIIGQNDQILSEVDTPLIESLVNHIVTDETLCESRTRPIFANITKRISEGLIDPSTTTRLLNILIKEGLKTFEGEAELSEKEQNLAIERLFTIMKTESGEESEEIVEDPDDPFAGSVLLKNYNRIISDNRTFLPTM